MSLTDRERLLALLGSGSGVEFSGALLRDLLGPMVYIVWRGDQALYIGMSKHGVGRFARHPVVTRSLQDTDRLVCWPMPDARSARQLERLLMLGTCAQ